MPASAFLTAFFHSQQKLTNYSYVLDWVVKTMAKEPNALHKQLQSKSLTGAMWAQGNPSVGVNKATQMARVNISWMCLKCTTESTSSFLRSLGQQDITTMPSRKQPFVSVAVM